MPVIGQQRVTSATRREGDVQPAAVTRSQNRGSLAAAIRQARRRHCGVAVVKDLDGRIEARPDSSVCEGYLRITVAPATAPPGEG